MAELAKRLNLQGEGDPCQSQLSWENNHTNDNLREGPTSFFAPNVPGSSD